MAHPVADMIMPFLRWRVRNFILPRSGDRHLGRRRVSGGGGDHADQHDGGGEVQVLPLGEGMLLRGGATGTPVAVQQD